MTSYILDLLTSKILKIIKNFANAFLIMYADKIFISVGRLRPQQKNMVFVEMNYL